MWKEEKRPFLVALMFADQQNDSLNVLEDAVLLCVAVKMFLSLSELGFSLPCIPFMQSDLALRSIIQPSFKLQEENIFFQEERIL